MATASSPQTRVQISLVVSCNPRPFVNVVALLGGHPRPWKAGLDNQLPCCVGSTGLGRLVFHGPDEQGSARGVLIFGQR